MGEGVKVLIGIKTSHKDLFGVAEVPRTKTWIFLLYSSALFLLGVKESHDVTTSSI